jgi:hypothetical protein
MDIENVASNRFYCEKTIAQMCIFISATHG